MSYANSGQKRFVTEQNPRYRVHQARLFSPLAVLSVKRSSTAPTNVGLRRNAHNRHYCETQENGDSDAQYAKRRKGKLNTQHCVPGSMIITAIERRKLRSSREKILDNTEPCQTNIRRIQCCCGLTIMIIFSW